MLIKMKKSKHGSSDGCHVQMFEEGKQYEVSDRLADIFINQMDVAEEVKAKKELSKEEKVDEDLIINKKKAPATYNKKVMNKEEEDK